jgi:hypothetical protein
MPGIIRISACLQPSGGQYAFINGHISDVWLFRFLNMPEYFTVDQPFNHDEKTDSLLNVVIA